jgi:hypothetical protein
LDNFLDRRALRVWENEGGAVANATTASMSPVRDCNRETQVVTLDRLGPTPQRIESDIIPTPFTYEGAF